MADGPAALVDAERARLRDRIERNEARSNHDATERTVRGRCGTIPQTEAGVPAWAQAAAQHTAETDPAVIEARTMAEQARDELRELTRRHSQESIALSQRAFGNTTPSTVVRRVAQLHRQAQDSQTLERLEALPLPEDAKLVRERALHVEAERLAAEQDRKAAEARAQQLGQSLTRPSDPRRPGAERGIGLSL